MIVFILFILITPNGTSILIINETIIKIMIMIFF